MIECNSIEKINNKSGEYRKDFMKIKFDLDDNLPLNKIFKFYNVKIVIRPVSQEDKKIYLQVIIDECLYKL